MDYYGDRKKWREVDRLKYPFGGRYVDFLVGLDVVANREKKQGGDCVLIWSMSGRLYHMMR